MAMNEVVVAEKAVQDLQAQQLMYRRHGSPIDLTKEIAAAQAAFEAAETEQLEFMAVQEWKKGPRNPSEAQQNVDIAIATGTLPPPRPEQPPAEWVAAFVQHNRALWAQRRFHEQLKG